MRPMRRGSWAAATVVRSVKPNERCEGDVSMNPMTPRFSLSIPGWLQLIVGSVIAVSCNSGPDIVDVGSPLLTPSDFTAVVSRIGLEPDSGVSATYARLDVILLNQLGAEPGEGEPPRAILVVPKSTRVFVDDQRQALIRPQDIKVGDSIRVWRAVGPADSTAVAVPTYTTRQIFVTRHVRVRVAPQNARTILARGALVLGCIVGPWITLGVARSRRARRAAGTDTAIAGLISEAVALVAGAFAFGLIGIVVAVLFPFCTDYAILIAACGAFGGLVAAGIGMSQGLRAARHSTDWIAGVMSMAASVFLTAYSILLLC